MDQSQKNRELQKKRTILYFIQAAEELIEEKGQDNITVREVANRAGYNIATLYNYFENINHLILFTSIKHLNNYVIDLPKCIYNAKTPMDRFYNSWKCFCHHAFAHPEVFHMIFFGNLSREVVENSLQLYYELFPDSLEKVDDDFLDMMTCSDFVTRNMKTFQLITLPETSVVPSDQKLLFYSQLTSLIFQSMLYNAIEKEKAGTLSIEEETDTFFMYLKKILEN